MSPILACACCSDSPGCPLPGCGGRHHERCRVRADTGGISCLRTCYQGQCCSHLHPVRVCLLWMTSAPDKLDKEARSQRQLLGVPSHDALASLRCR